MNSQSVLVIGVDPRRVPGPWDPEPVVVAIEAGLRQFDQHAPAAAIAFNNSPTDTYEAAARWLKG